MGTGFTVDTPLKVARYGISSAISLDDNLVEQMREYHCKRADEPYEKISNKAEDSRARRITAYLNLLDRLVKKQVVALQASPFEEGSEITKYYRLLPESPLKRLYNSMVESTDPEAKRLAQEELRRRAIPGSIDVNIMAKADRDLYRGGIKLPPEYALAMAALRGYAKSTLRSSIIFSAGMNQRLYSYIGHFDDFFPDKNGILPKKIILKVSDFRSAIIQGKILAKRGLWISEYRVESGLNCGGHAFPSKGSLIGTILKEFKEKKSELIDQLNEMYYKALTKLGKNSVGLPYSMRITVQGGIGTADENQLLHELFEVDGTGWGTPFLLVPEVTNVDDDHLNKLIKATDKDVLLSESSPLGAPFWNLHDSASEEARRQRISSGKPGCACPQGFLVSNTEFSEIPICTASRTYQKAKLISLLKEGLSSQKIKLMKESILKKSCICRDLGGAVRVKNDIDPDAKPAICCGPNIINFNKIASLEELIDHIYGRISHFTNPDRPHMFIRELMLNVDYLRSEIEKFSQGLISRKPKYFQEFKENLLKGIDYYQHLADKYVEEFKEHHQLDIKALQNIRETIENIQLVFKPAACVKT
ncbi:MAG: hypothetical protein GY839_21305 [candidate division Zixibacteria bacterium]|nr:hypothetical protein [candidate division Zixibacteria bacterium]